MKRGVQPRASYDHKTSNSRGLLKLQHIHSVEEHATYRGWGDILKILFHV